MPSGISSGRGEQPILYRCKSLRRCKMKEQRNILLRSILLLALGVAIAYVTWYLMGMKESGWLVLLIFAPNIVVFLYSGIIRELKIKDLVDLVLSDMANEPVKGDFESHTTPLKEEDLFGPIA